APEPGADPAAPVTHRADPRGGRRRRRWPLVVAVVLLVLLLAAAVVAGVHLHRTSQAWQERADQYLGAAQDLGEDLAGTQRDLAGAQAELEAVRTQLTTAQERIVELAD